MSQPSLFPTRDAFAQAQTMLDKHMVGPRPIKMGKKQTRLSHSFLWIDERLFAIAKETVKDKKDHLIGKGGINKVKFCQDIEGKLYALRIEPHPLARSDNIEKIPSNRQELCIHLNLTKQQQTKMVLIKLGYFQACAQINQKSYLVSSYFPGKDLGRYIVNHSWHEDIHLHDIVLGACWEVKRLHDFNIVHGDIKPNNMIINNQGEIKLIDFDSAVLLSDYMQTYKPGRWICAKEYAAPEVKEKQFIHKASDLYSLGVTIRAIIRFSKSYQNFMMENRVTTWLTNKLFLWDEDVTFYEKIARQLQREKIEDRKPIHKIIQKIQKHHDKRKEQRYLRIGLVSFIAAVLFISTSTMMSPLLIGLAMMPTLLTIVAYGRQRLMKSAFSQINESSVSPQINFEPIKQLTQEQRSSLKQGYQASQSIFSQALTWAYPSCYNKAYYAGLRLHDLAPQVDWGNMENDETTPPPLTYTSHGSN